MAMACRPSAVPCAASFLQATAKATATSGSVRRRWWELRAGTLDVLSLDKAPVKSQAFLAPKSAAWLRSGRSGSKSPGRMSEPTGRFPTALGAQFVRHGPRYALGVVLLAIYQASQYWF